MNRGILYLVWKGECDPTEVLNRSVASIKHWHPDLPYKIVEMPTGSNLLCKSQMFDLSPFDETLFLDADTTVLGKLDYGFIKMQQHGIACCINANPWQRRYYKIEQHPDEVEYSSGVVFFDKRPGVAKVFDRWKANHSFDSSSLFMATEGVRRQTYNDQALFTLAIQQEQFNPFILPLNWNLYPKWQKHFWGEVKIFHGYDDIPESLLAWNEKQRAPGAVIQCVALP